MPQDQEEIKDGQKSDEEAILDRLKMLKVQSDKKK